MPHLLIAGALHPDGVTLLKSSAGVSFDYVTETSEESFLPFIEEADALVLRTQPLRAETVARAGRLRIVSRHGVGFDAVDAEALAARGIPLTIVGDVNSQSVAEHAMMLLLAAVKRLMRNDAAVRGGTNWNYRELLEAEDIHGKSLLILGYGRIGRRLAVLADAFGMEVAAYDPFIPVDSWPNGPATRAETLVEALAQADCVSLNLPPADKPQVGAAEIAAMKPGAVLVNTARGATVDEAALIAALTSGQLGAAGLDVFETEPPVDGSPFAGFSQVVLTPHIAGLSKQSAARMAVASVQNVLDFFSGSLDPALIVNGVIPDGAP